MAWMELVWITVQERACFVNQKANFCPHADLTQLPGSHPACVNRGVNQGMDPERFISYMVQGFRITSPQVQQISVD